MSLSDNKRLKMLYTFHERGFWDFWTRAPTPTPTPTPPKKKDNKHKVILRMPSDTKQFQITIKEEEESE